MPDRKLMVVTWIDHFSRNAWHSVEPVDLEPLEVVSVGWSVGENDEMLALAHSLSNIDRSTCTTSILQVAITDRYEVVF